MGDTKQDVSGKAALSGLLVGFGSSVSLCRQQGAGCQSPSQESAISTSLIIPNRWNGLGLSRTQSQPGIIAEAVIMI